MVTWVAIGFAFAGVVFWALTGVGKWSNVPDYGDAAFSYYTTWAVAHGQFACAYPPQHFAGLPVPDRPYSYIAPLYPLVAGALSALLGLGARAAFPTSLAMGPHCGNALAAMHSWAGITRVTTPTVELGFLMWIVLIAGYLSTISLASYPLGRWELVGLGVVGLSFPLLDAMIHYFHPEDALGLGLILLAIRPVVRRRWWVAGSVLGLAFVAHQLAVVVLVVVLVISPWQAKWRILAAFLLTVSAVVAPFIVLQDGGSWRNIIAGSSIPQGVRSTLVGELHLSIHTSGVIARGAPILAAFALAWVMRRRHAQLATLELTSLIIVTLGLRLVFEVNLFGYYFLALAVGLVILEVMQRRFRGTVAAWLMLEAVVYSQFDIGAYSQGGTWAMFAVSIVPMFLAAAGVCVVLLQLSRHRIEWTWLAYLVIVSATMLIGMHSKSPIVMAGPLWLWQVILVCSGLMLASEPLWRIRRVGEPAESSQVRDTSSVL